MQKSKLPKSHHYSVYVIELDDRVWNSGKFRRCNPEYVMGKPFVYVGMTGLDPDDMDSVAPAFGIADAMAREIVYWNDEGGPGCESPEHRWRRMREWVAAQIKTDG